MKKLNYMAISEEFFLLIRGSLSDSTNESDSMQPSPNKS